MRLDEAYHMLNAPKLKHTTIPEQLQKRNIDDELQPSWNTTTKIRIYYRSFPLLGIMAGSAGDYSSLHSLSLSTHPPFPLLYTTA